MMNSEFAELRNLVFHEDWPLAVEPEFLCNPLSDADKTLRAEGIVDLMFEESVSGRNVLDFGCGEGHVAAEIARQGAKHVVGYDVAVASGWASLAFGNGSLMFTHDLNLVRDKGPYDAILVYDVLDHVEGVTVPTIVKLLGNLGHGGTKIYARCHPWTSRHGGHLYHSLNKAFAHLVFTRDELAELKVASPLPLALRGNLTDYRGLFPQADRQWRSRVRLSEQPKEWFRRGFRNAYRNIVQECGPTSLRNWLYHAQLPATYERIQRIPVEPFFLEHAALTRRFARTFGTIDCALGLMASKMEITFVDYVVELK